MERCFVCGIKKPKRFCPALEKPVCSKCCAERRKTRDDCPKDCPHLMEAKDLERKRMEAATKRHQEYLLVRARTFGDVSESFISILDLEKKIFLYSKENPSLTDQDVLAALEHLENISGELTIVSSPPNALALWLENSAKATTSKEKEKKAFPELLLYALPNRNEVKALLGKLRQIIQAENKSGGYLKRMKAYFLDLEKVKGKEERLETRSRWGRETGSGLIIP